ncbi:pyridoxal phosphate synthase yaaE subunit [Frankineae bacterium MT45]|nr:pyridoxal phosphate synthase yaaE subunit [Frankineae bacterium MT45]
MQQLTVGVLALQGDVREHLQALQAAGVNAIAVRRPQELDLVDGLVLPGGESTTIAKLARIFELLEPLRARIASGLPTYGSCAGMILLADRITGGVAGQETVGGIDMTVRRNAFGRQIESFEAELEVAGLAGAPMRAVFIRAPWVEAIGPKATAVATVAQGPAAGRIVAVRQQHLLATSFHPELTGDGRIHAYFCEMVADAVATRAPASLGQAHGLAEEQAQSAVRRVGNPA